MVKYLLLNDGGHWGLEGYFPSQVTDGPVVLHILSDRKFNPNLIILLLKATATIY